MMFAGNPSGKVDVSYKAHGIGVGHAGHRHFHYIERVLMIRSPSVSMVCFRAVMSYRFAPIP